jgi:hypothetical protein
MTISVKEREREREKREPQVLRGNNQCCSVLD